MNVCLYVCMYVYTYIYGIYVLVDIHTHSVGTHACTCVLHICIHAYTDTHM